MSTVVVERLRDIAAAVRQLPSFYWSQGPFQDHWSRVVSEGAKLIREAERLGAFHGDSSYGEIRKKLAHPNCHTDQIGPGPAPDIPAWAYSVWSAVVDTLAPGFRGFEEEAEIVARVIEAEADRIEAQLRRNGDGKKVPKPWKPRPKTWKIIKLMNEGLSNNTIMERLGVEVCKSAGNIRRIRSKAKKYGLLELAKPAKT